MRRFTYTIEWSGPDKPAKEFWEDRLESLFIEFSELKGLQWANASESYQAKVPLKKR